MEARICIATAKVIAVTKMQASERNSLARVATPGGSQTAARAAKPPMAARMPTTSPIDRSPCSNVRRAWLSDSREIQPSRPGLPASVKSSTHEPIVNAKVTMAAVAAPSEMDAANNAMAPISKP